MKAVETSATTSIMAEELPASMRAAVYTSASNGLEKSLKVEAVPLPAQANSLPDGHVLVKTSFASLNPVDYKIAESPASFFFPKPKIPALDFSGVAIKSNASHIKAGDRVFGSTVAPNFGALAEYLVAPSNGIAVVPEGVKLEDAATIAVTGLTAYQTLAPYIKRGGKVLINGGSGGVGTFAIQFAKVLGARVTAVCSGPNVELCKSLGADEVVDYRAVDLVQHLKDKGTEYDHILDTAFRNSDLYWQAHHYLKAKGVYVTIAGQTNLTFAKSLAAIFLLPSWLGGGQRPFKFLAVAANSAEFEIIAKWIKEGKAKAVLANVLGLEQAGKGYEQLKTDRTRGKIVIKI